MFHCTKRIIEGIGKEDQQSYKRERDFINEVLTLLNQLIPIIYLWKALMSALVTVFKPSKKPLPTVFNLNLLRAG